jgi:hypothetical protein
MRWPVTVMDGTLTAWEMRERTAFSFSAEGLPDGGSGLVKPYQTMLGPVLHPSVLYW